MKMIELLVDDINKSIDEIQQNRKRLWNEMNKTVQDSKLEIEWIKKNKTAGVIKKLGNLTCTFRGAFSEEEKRWKKEYQWLKIL